MMASETIDLSVPVGDGSAAAATSAIAQMLAAERDVKTLSGARLAEMSLREASSALSEFERTTARGPAPSMAEAAKDGVEARIRLDALTADPAFLAKIERGDAATVKAFNDLTKQVAEGADPAALAQMGLVPVGGRGETTTPDNQNTIQEMASFAEALRAQGISEPAIREALTGGSKSSPGIYRAALHRREERLSDKEWVGRLLAGGFSENREFTLLSIVLAGEVVAG
jgi:hypothetical protein